MQSTTNEDKLIAMVSELTGTINSILERLEKLEKTHNSDSVYLDGSPDYVKKYIQKGGDVGGR